MSARYNLSARRGWALKKDFRLKAEGGGPFDLTGSIVRVVVSARGMAPIVKSSAEGTLLLQDVDGVVRLRLSPEEVNRLPTGTPAPRYTIERSIGGEDELLLEGIVKLELGEDDDV